MDAKTIEMFFNQRKSYLFYDGSNLVLWFGWLQHKHCWLNLSVDSRVKARQQNSRSLGISTVFTVN